MATRKSGRRQRAGRSPSRRRSPRYLKVDAVRYNRGMANTSSAITRTKSKTQCLQDEIDSRRKEIKTDSYPMSIGELANLYRDRELDIHPEFQRFFRWTEFQKSRWIESVLLGIPLPSIFVAQRDDGVWDVVDGLQRLSTLFQFMGLLRDQDDRMVTPLVLTGTKYLPSLEGMKWHSKGGGFTLEQQRYVKRAKLDMQIVLRESDPSSKYELFQRLNTGGSSLSDQELRNCLLISLNNPMYEWLKRLSENPAFTVCVTVSERLVQEQYDMELALRFVLLRRIKEEELPKFGTAIGEFLTERMIEFAKEQVDLEKEEKVFQDVFTALATALEDDAFRKYDRTATTPRFTGGFSISAFEVIALGLGYHHPRSRGLSDSRALRSLVIDRVWKDTTFMTSTGLAAASRLPVTLKRGRDVFKP
jgi:hypothetical protein